MSKSEKKPKLPSFATMAKNFAKDLAEYVKQGAPNVTPSNYKNRLKACEACPHLIKEKMRCGKCGCLVEHKAKWKTTNCPDKPTRWPAELIIKDYDHKRRPNTENIDKTQSSDK